MKAIVAVDKNWGIGKDGDQLCYLSADLKRFKELTMGHPVILGRKTLSTFPGGAAFEGPAEPDPLPKPGVSGGGRGGLPRFGSPFTGVSR